MPRPAVSLVAAVARDGGIGHRGGLLVRLPDDLRRLKQITLGTPIVMGRKTWQSIGRPLPGRRNIVVTRDPAFRAEGADVVTTLDAALALAAPAPLVHVLGGAEIYSLALPIADELQLTEIDAEFPADVFFPAWDRRGFAQVAREPRETAEGLRYAFVTYKKLPQGD
ncbi:MAG: dihydrofolate reductase [Caldimonas sp.]